MKYSITVKIKSTCDNYLGLCQSNWAAAPRRSIKHYSERVFLDEVYIQAIEFWVEKNGMKDYACLKSRKLARNELENPLANM